MYIYMYKYLSDSPRFCSKWTAGVPPLRPDIEDVVRDANITQEELHELERDEERPGGPVRAGWGGS